jgi:hypothetical protein
VQSLAAKRSDAANAKEARKVATDERKRKREEERILQIQKKKEHDEAKVEEAREKAYWVEVASWGWGNDLQARMKSSLPPPPGSYRGVYVGTVPAWCITNQRRRRLVLDLRRDGACFTGRRAADNVVFARNGASSLHGHGASMGEALAPHAG